jgi:hypothetical protein
MSTTIEFAPITLNGEPVVTRRTIHLLAIDGWLYEQEFAASEDCGCRRCSLHDDFGGCLVAEAQWAMIEWMMMT